MALLFMDSFDHFTGVTIPSGAGGDVLDKWTWWITGNTNWDLSGIYVGTGRHGSSGLRFRVDGAGFGGSIFVKSVTPGDNTIIVGLGVNSVSPFSYIINSGTDPASSSSGCLLSVWSGSTAQCWVQLTQGGVLQVYRGTTPIPGAVTSIGLSQNTWAFVEILLTIHNTAGVITIKIDGQTALNLTSQNTRNGTTNDYNSFRLGGFNSGSNLVIDVDDLYVLDGSGAAPRNTFLGDSRVDPRFTMTPAGATSAWTPTGASPNWECVNDTPTPNDDTDYNATATVGAVDTFTMQDAPVSGVTIYGVQHCLNMKKNDVGPCTVAPVIRHGGTDLPGTAVPMSTSYGYKLQIAPEVAPGVAWTEANFNAAEFGYKRVT